MLIVKLSWKRQQSLCIDAGGCIAQGHMSISQWGGDITFLQVNQREEDKVLNIRNCEMLFRDITKTPILCTLHYSIETAEKLQLYKKSVTTSCLVALCAVWDMVSQVSMLYMLLSLCMGWTLSRNRKPQSRPLQWEQSPASTAVAVGGVFTQVGTFLFVHHSLFFSWRSKSWLSVHGTVFLGRAAVVGAVFRSRGWPPQLPCPAEPGRAPPHGTPSPAHPAAGLHPLPDYLHWEKHPEERLLPLLRQSKARTCTNIKKINKHTIVFIAVSQLPSQ